MIQCLLPSRRGANLTQGVKRMYQMLKEKSKWNGERAIKFARKLVETRGTSMEESAVAKLVEDEMKKIGFDKVLTDDAGNVVGVLMGRRAEPSVLLNSHMDTASAGDESLWKHSPYSAKIDGKRLYGLGASDCKGGLAAQLYTVELLKHSMLPLDGTLVVSATVGEEKGGSVGVRKLLSETLPEIGIKPDFAILGEPTSLGVYYGHDGWMEVEVKVEGSNPFQVEDTAREIYKDFEREDIHVDPPLFELRTGIRSATINIAKRFGQSEEPEEVIRNLKHEAMLIAGNTGNVAVQVALKTDKTKCFTGKTTVVKHLTNAWTTDPFNVYLSRACQSLKAGGCEVNPGKWKLGRLGMGTAGAVLVNDYKIPTIGYGPGNEEAVHSPNEYVELDKVIEAVYGTTIIVHGLIGTPVFGWTMDEI